MPIGLSICLLFSTLLFPSRGIFAGDLSKAFQARHGSGAEIALMLTSMLRAAGLEPHPVLISTRDR